MNAPIKTSRFSRRALLKGGALTVGFALAGAAHGRVRARRRAARARMLDPKEVDAFLAVNADGTVTVFCGKVDLGQGLRIAIPQIAAEELGIGVDKIKYVEGDTALTPDQGRTSGSNGIQRGGVQIRQAAATARKALIELAAQRLNAPAEDLVVADGEVRPKAGGAGIGFRRPARRASSSTSSSIRRRRSRIRRTTRSSASRCRGRTCRRNAPAATSTCRTSPCPNMLHARVIRPPAIGAKLASVDETLGQAICRARRSCAIKDFLAVVADDEWTAVRAARALKAQWSEGTGLAGAGRTRRRRCAPIPVNGDETLINKGSAGAPRPDGAKALAGHLFLADAEPRLDRTVLRGRRCAATSGDGVDRLAGHAWQSQHLRALPRLAAREGAADLSRRLRLLRHERPRGRGGRRRDPVARGRPPGAGAMVARGRAWLGSRKVRRSCSTFPARSSADGHILDWRTEMWIPQTTQGTAQHSAARARTPPGSSNVPGLNAGLHLAEWRSALCGGPHPGRSRIG